ncbi:hypothetical protein OR16_41646 [Cupriavidus basilensis OR16]|uniref:Uncharacterized protein n=1 Tax=Cupriavidus basilensis OR16 TaxID=1127483 RepID=H1SIK5_9BURK|nr:hypothetical protein [Cupriavidus basilensis]EHP37649.1 hypothetical protein OR16_41646 [Cupriavidus basilensis OR16]
MSILSIPHVPFSLSIDGSRRFFLRIGNRALHVCPDYVTRNRTPRLFEAHAGEDKGSWELLILRRWLVTASLES